MPLTSTDPSLEDVFIAARQPLVRIARRILRNAELADDAVQDAFLRIAQMPRSLHVERPVAYWSRVVRNIALDYLRRQEHENAYRVHGVDIESLEVAGGPSPEGAVLEWETVRLIDKALNGVSPKAREAFELYRIKGLTQRQIAARMGCALGLVNARIAEACKAIEKYGALLR